MHRYCQFLFFYEVMGQNALIRLTSLVQYYAGVDVEKPALTAASPPAPKRSPGIGEAPQSVRRFFRTFGNTVDGGRTMQGPRKSRFQLKQSASNPPE
jgi:hypothetical protein